MAAPTTFAVTVVEEGENFNVSVQIITRGALGLEDAISIFAAAATEPDEAEVTYESGLKVKFDAAPDPCTGN